MVWTNESTAIFNAAISAAAVVGAVFISSYLSRRREHEADWRKLKLERYQEFVLALSGNVEGRSSPATQRRYSYAFNAMTLIAPEKVLIPLDAFQKHISIKNAAKRQLAEDDRLYNLLLNAMREDVHPNGSAKAAHSFVLIGVPPE
jgi:hypothetical protein